MARKKRRSNSSAKGSGFERKLAVVFSEWWTEGERDDVFWRTEGSGSRATSRAKRGKMTRFQYGDMTFTDPIGQPLIDAISFEFKSYKSYELLSVFKQTDPNKSWLEFWCETLVDAELSQREPVLITRQNNHENIMWVGWDFSYDLVGACGFDPSPRMLLHLKSQRVRMKHNKTYDLEGQIVVGFLLSDFLDVIDPIALKEMLYDTGRATRG